MGASVALRLSGNMLVFLARARQVAEHRGHNHVDPDHLLLGKTVSDPTYYKQKSLLNHASTSIIRTL